MTLRFPPQFDPFSPVIVATEQLGHVADETQLAGIRQSMNALGPNATEAEATLLVDTVEALIASELPPGTHGLKHTYTPGLYSREIFMPQFSLLTSRIHETEHQFIILTGVVMVWTRETGSRVHRAPYEGVTMPGTRRILYTFEDTRWVTFHANPDNLTDPDEILRKITRRHNNPLLNRALGGVFQ